MLSEMKRFRPQATIFEVNKSKKAEGLEVMKNKRQTHDGFLAKKRQKLEEAQSLLAKLEKRDLPKVVYEIKFNPAQNENWLKMDKDQWKRDLIRSLVII